MVRTKADGGARKAVAAKAPRKALAPARPAPVSPKGGAGGKKDKYGGGNVVCPQPVPEWQKSISHFFSGSGSSRSTGKENMDPDAEAGPSSSKDIDRIEKEEEQGTSSPPVEDEDMEQEEEQEEKDKEEEQQEEPPSSSKKFQRNNCISDDSDDD